MRSRIITWLVITIFLLSGSTVAAFSWRQPRIQDTMGIVSMNGFNITVSTSDAEGKWLGSSIRSKDSEDIIRDLPAHRVTRTGRKTWVVTGLGNGKGLEYIVKLWERKINRGECEDGPCKWCLKNGYHLEGELDSSGWKRIMTGGW